MRLILTRHGETEENKKGIMQGHLPGTLSKEGIEQAKKLAIRLKDVPLDAVYCSDLARAKDTAKEILKFHINTPIFYVPELREGALGSFTGKHRSEVNFNERSNDIESIDSMKIRADNLLSSVHKKYPNGTVLFIGHNGINKSILGIILHKNNEEIPSQQNTAINIFDIKENGEHIIHILNNTEHLQ